MSLLRVKYLRKKRILALIVILTLTSTLFSVTAYSFLGFYNGFSAFEGQTNNIIAIYSERGNSPFSGIVPISLQDNLTRVHGVISTSPEAITPCIINGQSIFVRGVIPQELSNLNQLTILQGENLNLTDTNSAIIGVNVAQRLNLKPGDEILATGVLSEKYAELQIKGVFRSDSALDDEALVPLYVGQWLRGIPYDQVTLIRAKIDLTQTNSNIVYQEIANQTSAQPSSPGTSNSQTEQELQGLIPLAQTNVNIQNIGVAESQQFMTSYLDRFGISKDTLIILSIAVLIFASGTAIVAITLFIKQHDTETSILRSIGVTSRKLKRDLFLKMLFWSLIATTIGTVVSVVVLMVFQNMGYLQVLSHTITFQIDPLVIAANFILLALLVGVNIARMEFKQ